MSKSSKAEIEFNEVTSKLPKSLHTFIVKQPYRFPQSVDSDPMETFLIAKKC